MTRLCPPRQRTSGERRALWLLVKHEENGFIYTDLVLRLTLEQQRKQQLQLYYLCLQVAVQACNLSSSM